jgi:hypothetical protein
MNAAVQVGAANAGSMPQRRTQAATLQVAALRLCMTQAAVSREGCARPGVDGHVFQVTRGTASLEHGIVESLAQGMGQQ